MNTTSKNNMEVAGRSVFIEVLREELEQRHIHVKMIGVKNLEKEKALTGIQRLFNVN